MSHVVLKNINKAFIKDEFIVRELNLEIKAGEFVVLLGPSGCGKTTTLRMIAGLEEATSGDICIAGKKVNDLPPRDRDLAMVFQNYALYPHMNVFENMAFGLKARKVARSEIEERVKDTAKMLGMDMYLDRKPKHLSGGERQRVALGRAIVRHPKVFLMDEPLSNLDARLRLQMRFELLRLHQQLGITTIYVTHDQVEALTLGDRLVLMNKGVVQQIGDPLTMYNRPGNQYVAGFIGSPPMNFFDATLDARDGALLLEAEGLNLDLTGTEDMDHYVGRKMVVGIRPEHIAERVSGKETAGRQTVKAVVDVVEPVGATELLYATVGGQQFVASVEAGGRIFDRHKLTGKEIDFLFDITKLHFFDKDTQEAVLNP